MTPSPQEVAAFIQGLRTRARLSYHRHDNAKAHFDDRAAAVLTAQAARIAELEGQVAHWKAVASYYQPTGHEAKVAALERECAELRNAMDAVAHIRTTNWADERTLLEGEIANLRKVTATAKPTEGRT